MLQPLRAELGRGTAIGTRPLERPPTVGTVGHDNARGECGVGDLRRRALADIGGRKLVGALALHGRQERRFGDRPQLELDFLRIDVLAEKLDHSIECRAAIALDRGDQQHVPIPVLHVLGLSLRIRSNAVAQFGDRQPFLSRPPIVSALTRCRHRTQK